MFKPLVNTGQKPSILDGSTTPQITKLKIQHKVEYYEVQQYNHTNKAMKFLLIGAADKNQLHNMF